jgi:PIN domain nuclease of toxin-antitoxin system
VVDGPAYVFDASALLCYLLREEGWERVGALLLQPAEIAIGAANWAEVLSNIALRGLEPHSYAQQLTNQGILGQVLHIYPLDDLLARETARLHRLTRSAGLSLADRACLALGRHLQKPVLTTDRAWKKLHVGVKIEVLR